MEPYVFQIWMSKKEDGIPTTPSESIQNMMQQWKQEFPNYEVWNEISMRQYIQETDAAYLEKYDSFKNWIMRCDAFRYFLLYHRGGLYVDADTLLDEASKLRQIISQHKILIVSYDPTSKAPKLKNSFLWADQPGYNFFYRAYQEVDTLTSNVFDAAGPSHLRNIYLTEKANKIDLIHARDLPITHYSNISWMNDQIWLGLSAYWFWILIIVLILIIVIFLLRPYVNPYFNRFKSWENYSFRDMNPSNDKGFYF